MDDRDLEARLMTRLRARFEDVQVPVDLASNVAQAIATPRGPVGFDLRTRGRWLGWATVAAAVVIAIATVGAGVITLPGPGTNPTPSPPASNLALASLSQFIVLPPPGNPDKQASSLAADVLAARLRGLGIGNFTSGIGYVITFSVPVDGTSDETIRTVLSATGDVRIVPLPAADYGAGMRIASLGAPLPKDEPALFGWDGIESMVSVALDGAPILAMTPRAPAARAFADFATENLGETYAVVVDGRVALLPIAQQAAADGSINLSNGQTPGGSEPSAAYFETVGILAGGELPEAWRGASVPVLWSRDRAVASALAASGGGTIQDAGQSAEQAVAGGAWQVVWNIEVVPTACVGPNSCVSPGWSTFVKVDAVNGDVLQIGALAP